jgi:hypothetical protein
MVIMWTIQLAPIWAIAHWLSSLKRSASCLLRRLQSDWLTIMAGHRKNLLTQFQSWTVSMDLKMPLSLKMAARSAGHRQFATMFEWCSQALRLLTGPALTGGSPRKKRWQPYWPVAQAVSGNASLLKTCNFAVFSI